MRRCSAVDAGAAFLATGKHDLQGFERPAGLQNDLVAFKLLGAKIPFLGALLHVALPEALSLGKPGPLSSLALRCQGESCRFVVGRPEGRQRRRQLHGPRDPERQREERPGAHRLSTSDRRGRVNAAAGPPGN